MTNLKQRPIKFRAWHDPSKKMVYFDNSKAAKDRYIAQHLCKLLAGEHEDGVLMQFIGKKDKQGKELYEGDIVKFRNHPDKQKIGVVSWHETTACFSLSVKDDIVLYRVNPNTQIEIIGNIFEHPELLEDK